MDARHLALKVLYQVNEEDAYANLALDQALAQFKLADPRDKGLATELVYGCVKYKGRLDWVINQFAKPKVQKMAPWIRNIIRLGLFQIMFLDKVPVSAAINESVKLAKKYGHPGTVKFVNGVLRNIVRKKEKIVFPDIMKDPIEHISIYYSFPMWLVERWVKDFGVENTIKLCVYFNNPSPLWVRTNTLRTSRAQLVGLLHNQGIHCRESEKVPEGIQILQSLDLGRLDLFKKGMFTVQDESSMLVGHVVKPQKEQIVLDVCSGPGGKTSHLAQLMEDSGKIFALDVHEHRLELIRQTCQRLGISIVETLLKDARFTTQIVKQLVDAVLVDAPCSGLGVLGRRPDARWRKKSEDIGQLKILQREILTEAAQLVKPGGTLVYSTCTITSEENNEVIQEFLAENKDFYLDKKLTEYLPFDLEEGQEGWVQFLPFKHQMDGFFIARMLRKG